MTDPNIHVRAARAHLERATAPNFLDDTMRGLLVEIERLRNHPIFAPHFGIDQDENRLIIHFKSDVDAAAAFEALGSPTRTADDA